MPESTSFFRRLYQYGALLVGHGWDMSAFWIATVYSIWTVVVPLDVQRKVMLAVHVDPAQRLVIWGFALAAFFLYAGFRAWDEERIARETAEKASPEELKRQLEVFRLRQWPTLNTATVNTLAKRVGDLPITLEGRDFRHIEIVREEPTDCVDLADDFISAFRQGSWELVDLPGHLWTTINPGIWVCAPKSDPRAPALLKVLNEIVGDEYKPIQYQAMSSGLREVSRENTGNSPDELLVIRLAIGRRRRPND
jgi:hypothetical protein